MDRLFIFGLVVSIVAMSAVRAATLDRYVLAANANEHVEDVRVNIDDKRTVHLVTAFAITDPDATVHTLKIDNDLGISATTLTRPDGRALVRIDLISAKGGEQNVRLLKYVEGLAGMTTAINFSICGDRIIRIVGGTNTGHCANLPVMAKPDQILGSCEVSCLGPYEGMPTVIASRARIAPISEPGEPMTISGRVTDPDGHPRSGIIVYAYHTNRLGLYPQPVPPRSEASYDQGQLRGWARTDAEGRYAFETVRPGSYPHTHNPQHVHMQVIEPGCSTYAINEIQFSDDPIRQHLNEENRKQADAEAAVVTPRKTAHGWEVTRDIKLGENVKGYKVCSGTH